MLEHDFEQSIAYWIAMTARAFERSLNEELAPHGITFPQWQVLAWLAIEKEMPQTHLAERLRVEPPTLVGILDRMERDGWIVRRTSPADRRKKMVRPSPRVKPLWSQITTCMKRIRAQATRGIDPERLEFMKRTLREIQHNLQSSKVLEEAG